MNKVCTKCGVDKSLDEFHNEKGAKRAQCKPCILATNKVWRDQNKERKSASAKKHREANKESIKAAKKRYYEENKERILKDQKEYYEENRQERREGQRQWYEKNREDNLAYQKRWRIENDEKYRATSKRWREENKHIIHARYQRIKHDPEFKAVQSMRTVLSNFLRNVGATKQGRTHEMLGYNYPEFKTHIEKQFQRGMGWHNHHLWHIDHIIPVIVHIRNGEKDPAIVNALSNLRPVWSKINLKKGETQTHLI